MTDTTQAAGLDRDEAIRIWHKHCDKFNIAMASHPASCVVDAMLECAALAAQAVPAGWKPVPVEPTQDMVDAAEKAETAHFLQDRKRGGKDPNLSFQGIYKAMIAASPAPDEAKEEPKKCACGSVLTANELHYYGSTCEKCESAGMAAIEAELNATPQPQAAQPVGYMSPQQLPRIVDPDGEFGAYIPMRRTPKGNFTLALYTAAPALTEEQERMETALGYVASLAHEGGLANLNEAGALVHIRRLSLPYWKDSGTQAESAARVNAAVRAALRSTHGGE